MAARWPAALAGETRVAWRRYLTLRDVLGAAEAGSELRAAICDGPVAVVLAAMDPAGFWVKAGLGYGPKYRSTVWAPFLLAQLGARLEADQRIGTAGVCVLDHALADGGQFSARASGAPWGAAAPGLPAELLDITFRHGPVPASLARFDDGVIVDVNDAFLRHSGYAREEVIGRTAAELGLWARAAECDRIRQALAVQRQVREAECDIRTKAGQERRVLASLERLDLHDAAYVLAMFQDITERARIDAELRRSEERFELVGRSTTDAEYEWNVETGMTRWNHGMRTLFGYPVDAEQPHNWWRQQVHPDDLTRTVQDLERALADGDQFWQWEYRYRRQDGGYAHVLDRGYILYDEARRPVRMVGAMIDITERVHLAEAQARAAMEERQRLAAGGDLERVAQTVGRLGEAAQQALKEMRLLVYQLRPLALETEGLVGALQHRLDAVEKRGGVQARLVVEGLVDLPAPVEEALFRIAQEALNNSLKHAAATAVTVTLCTGDGWAGLEIADNGRGFDPAQVDRGGLGLTTMRERAARLGGTLELLAPAGQGASVRVRVRTENIA